ncbi:hypothetical protein AWH56_018610 [Anaerobacillus isosaccharinicus]|uniref:Uncharacterized protein n=1 Tax=Anaerobacillus isosaccharinicus TaxID=1532552 RepID=A0A1S2LGD4_9BACI|nr:hypothetical protein [Anaerobacillus isosaccharinicus]MBA5587083.1 hypothetical protein [Anaerobacillus isosaccharinicus]QOY34721.1 hypothetical protein AWH56_018610 [Anaerobacillus isosaccharinicus]
MFINIDTFDDDLVEVIRLKSEQFEGNSSYVVELYLSRYLTLLRQYRNDLFNIFKNNELMAIVDALNATLFSATNLDELPKSIISGVEYDGLNLKWKVDSETFVRKLKDLSVAHCHALLDFSDYFWADVRKNFFYEGDRIEKIKGELLNSR